MTKINISVTTLALAVAFTSLGSMAATSVGTINHDIEFRGMILDTVPFWTWTLPQNTIRIDLQYNSGVVDDSTSTKVWDILQNRPHYKFLEGYMTPTRSDYALLGLNVDVKYLQDGKEIVPIYDNTNHNTLLALKAIGNKDTTPVDGQLALTLQPVLLLSQYEEGSTYYRIVKQLADVGVLQAYKNAPESYNNAKRVLSYQAKNKNLTFETDTLWPADSLADGITTVQDIEGAYASMITEGKLSFPKDSTLSQWQSVITVEVQYK